MATGHGAGGRRGAVERVMGAGGRESITAVDRLGVMAAIVESIAPGKTMVDEVAVAVMGPMVGGHAGTLAKASRIDKG